MPSQTREIRRRIRSITNTRKVTKAMEMVASAKMRRAVQAVLASRAYAAQAWDLVLDLAARTDPELHPLLRPASFPGEPVSKNVGVVVISSNRGLVGGFNTQLVLKARQHLDKYVYQATKLGKIILYGKKARSLVTRYRYDGVADFAKPDLLTGVEEVRPMAKEVIQGFTKRRYERVLIAYTDFVSTLVQRPRVRQLLPLQRDVELGAAGPAVISRPSARSREYLFEPNADVVLEALLPRLVELQLYQAVLESNASEHAARMVAMRNASDAAADLIDDLTLTYNQARQAAITQDLSEISASRAALEA
ncbi:MAG: ATP synthase F1 subunit gamma [Candidatus Kerfeldbacteria bacterium]|nr:ATP synthase F1 subunit gamma [Candidatus Kerfeldbacteria bacterium]